VSLAGVTATMNQTIQWQVNNVGDYAKDTQCQREQTEIIVW